MTLKEIVVVHRNTNRLDTSCLSRNSGNRLTSTLCMLIDRFRLKEVCQQVDKVYDLLKLVVQKMEISTENDDRQVFYNSFFTIFIQ